ncbi:unnamed protein product [Peronospora farinosa]|uniref:Uncharacterized protein n=1 Tax=Peronospora farinosa TaxID=134698 RepID=A0AAV0TLV0_9STRA|nr:unnamed protein product [Peronospora farinosa]CAI5722881.1 unnamed protein product [Peronospora farinosa]
MSESVGSTNESPITSSTKSFFLFSLTETCNKAKDCVTLTTKMNCRDKWVKKVFHRQKDGMKTAKPLEQKHKHNFFQRTIENLVHHHIKADNDKKSVWDEHSYKEELEMYIAESSADLCNDDNEPLDGSDDDTSEEEFDSMSICPRNAEIIDFASVITSIPLDKTEEFVVPPVEVPYKYRRQDSKGGVLVAGRYVLFTNWAFKRQMHHMGRLGSLPELGDVRLHSVEQVSIELYTEKLVEL